MNLLRFEPSFSSVVRGEQVWPLRNNQAGRPLLSLVLLSFVYRRPQRVRALRFRMQQQRRLPQTADAVVRTRSLLRWTGVSWWLLCMCDEPVEKSVLVLRHRCCCTVPWMMGEPKVTPPIYVSVYCCIDSIIYTVTYSSLSGD